MQTIAACVGAALGEIVGCFAFWAWQRLGKSALRLAPGMLSLALSTMSPSESPAARADARSLSATRPRASTIATASVRMAWRR